MLPTFPTDQTTLDLLDRAVRPDAERSAVDDLLALIAGLAGVADPEERYHTNDVIGALLGEVRRLRGAPCDDPTTFDPAAVDGVPGLGYRVDRMFAYLSVDDDGEGLLAAPTRTGMMPLVGADADRMLSLRPLAEHVARAVPGRPVRLVRFDRRTVIEEFGAGAEPRVATRAADTTRSPHRVMRGPRPGADPGRQAR